MEQISRRQNRNPFKSLQKTKNPFSIGFFFSKRFFGVAGFDGFFLFPPEAHDSPKKHTREQRASKGGKKKPIRTRAPMFSGRSKDTGQRPSLMKRLIQGIKSGPSSPTTPTTPTMIPNVPCECSQHGWLTKDQTKRRWFALVGSDLFWFDKQECDVHSKRATHWLPLEGDAVCARYGKQHIIVRSDGRQMILGPAEGTGSDEKSESAVMNEWLAKLKSAAEAQRTAPGANDSTRIRKTGMLTYKKMRHYFVLREKYMTWSKSEKVCANHALFFKCSHCHGTSHTLMHNSQTSYLERSK